MKSAAAWRLSFEMASMLALAEWKFDERPVLALSVTGI